MTNRESLDGFSWNLTSLSFAKICRKIPKISETVSTDLYVRLRNCACGEQPGYCGYCGYCGYMLSQRKWRIYLARRQVLSQRTSSKCLQCWQSCFMFRLVRAATEAPECFFLYDQLQSPHAFDVRAKSLNVSADERDSLIGKMIGWATGVWFQARAGFLPSPLRPDWLSLSRYFPGGTADGARSTDSL